MDYHRQALGFKLRKAARYVRLYGPKRTLVKVRGQYHMRLTGPAPRSRRMGDAPGPTAHVGLIGCGNFAYTTIAYYLAKNFGRVLRGVMDLEGARAASLATRYHAGYATDDAERILEDPHIDIVYIASNHASHAEYAVRALEAGKSVHIEKPHVVTDEQLERLRFAMALQRGRVTLGFNRPESRFGVEVRRLLAEQTGSSMFNWFIAGHEIPPDHWYYSPAEGGRVLGNLCHWTDFILQMVDSEDRLPIHIHPARAAQSDSDIAVSYVFGNDSIAAITFSAKGHAFEGVREHLSLHRGDLLLSLRDFKVLEADVGMRKIRHTLRFRDHGHEDAIRRAYAMTRSGGGGNPGCSISYVWQTAQLFLRTREALEQDRVITLNEAMMSPGADTYPARAAYATADPRSAT